MTRLLLVVLVTGCASQPRMECAPCPTRQDLCTPCQESVADARDWPKEQRPPRRCVADALDDYLAKDGTLVVRGKSTLMLGPGPYRVKRVCVEDQGSIRLCGGRTTIQLTGLEPSVIGGHGIGSDGNRETTVVLEGPARGIVYVLADNAHAPMEVLFDIPQGEATVALTGKTGLKLSSRSELAKMASNAAWGDTSNFPRCAPGAAGNTMMTEAEALALCHAEPQQPRGWPPVRGMRNEPTGQSVRVFGHRGEPQTFRVPRGVQQITVEAWGGGGGGGSGWKANAHGGGGAFVRATVPVQPGGELKIFVAGGGVSGPKPGFGNTAGSGGGASFVMRGETVLLVAGGGGGAGADGCSGCRLGSAAHGGGGGALEGARGDHAFCYRKDEDCATGGAGGTQRAGGAGGAWTQPKNPGVGRGADGVALRGGASAGWTGTSSGATGHMSGPAAGANGAGGGGGSGWYGGGGGGYRPTYCGGGGGGGSSYSHPQNTGAVLAPAAGPRPGAVADKHYGDEAGFGGSGGRNGMPGRVVIVY